MRSWPRGRRMKSGRTCGDSGWRSNRRASMGLDISAYRQGKFLHTTRPDDDQSLEHAMVYVNPEFPAQADDVQTACYAFAERYDFRAGSYSGYNWWRDQLC